MATIRLFKDIPWSQGGFHVLRFQNNSTQAAFFNGLESLEFTDIDYEPRPGANLNLPISYGEAREYTYMIYEHDNALDSYSYFFIEDYEYLNDNPTTRFIISPDYWQTHHLGMSIAPCTVHRRHMPRWNGSEPILYPVDEGGVRSQSLNTLLNIGDYNAPTGGDVWPILLITNKELSNPDHPDGIYYYLSWGGVGTLVRSPTANQYWTNPMSVTFNSQFEKWGVGLAPLIGAYLVPMTGYLNTSSGSGYTFPSQLGEEITAQEEHLFRVMRPDAIRGSISLSVPSPSKNTASGRAASESYEPMMYGETIRQVVVTDQYGRQMMSIPKNLLYNNTISIYYSMDIFSLTPQIRLKWGEGVTSEPKRFGVTNGMEVAFGCTPLDIPQSAWQDYLFQAQAADKQILENNISTRYLTTGVSALTGAASGYGYGAMYAESFNNSKRSPMKAGMAGLAMNAISGVGSLVNAYLQAGTDRDNFKLNEQKIRNTPSPPIAGNNPLGVLNSGGIRVYELIGDQPSRDIIYSQYQYYGYIVDKSMPVPLRTRYYYDYIQTRDCTVRGEMTNDAKTYLEALFNRGVTVWHAEAGLTHDVMYNYSYDNVEV